MRPVLQRGQEGRAQEGRPSPAVTHTTRASSPCSLPRPRAPPSALPVMPWAPWTWTPPPAPSHPASTGHSSSQGAGPALERQATPGVRHPTPQKVLPLSHTQRNLTQAQFQTQLSPPHLTWLPVQHRVHSHPAPSSSSPSSRPPYT